MAATIRIEVGTGELIDKITILKIKSDRITDAGKLSNIRHELDALTREREANVPQSAELDRLEADLRAVNEALWVIEDDIRACAAKKDFGETFIALARSVYRENDKRAALKRQINDVTGSTIVEEKSYTEFE